MKEALFSTNILGDFQQIFSITPSPFLILKADPPAFTILDANDSYLSITCTRRDDIIGRSAFDVFPDNPANQCAISGVNRLRASLEKVAATKEPDKIEEVSYDIPDGNNGFLNRYWNTVNVPVFDGDDIRYIVHSVEDITGRILKDKKETESLDRFKSIVMQTPVAMGVLRGEKMVIELANDALLELWGKADAVIGLPILEGLPELKDQPFPALLRQVYETGEEYYGYDAKVYLDRNGIMEECYFNFVYAPYKEVDGSITGVTVTAGEVTAQVKAKKELELSEKRFRNLVAEADVATAVYMGEDMVIQLANDAMIKLWGKDSSVIGKRVDKALPELEGQPFIDLLKNVYHTGNTYKATEDRADLVVDGKLQSFYFNFSYKALHNADGEIYGILNMAVDVTDIVLQRAKLEESEERLKIATEGTGVGTWDLNLKTRDIIYAPRLNEILGHDQATVLTHYDMRAQVHPDDVHILDRALEAARKTGIYSYEARMVWKDGSIHWIRNQGRIIYDNAGEPSRMLGMIMDITDQKAISEQLRASEEKHRKLAEELEQRVLDRTNDLKVANTELKRSNDELEQFAFITSHDLQEPLRKIRTFSNMLSDSNKTLLNDKGLVYLDKINTSARRMSELINGVLNFSRLRRNNEQLQAIDLNRVLDDVMIDLELLIKQQRVKIINEGLPAIDAIPLQMNQLFYNLLSNALKFSNTNSVEPSVVFSSRVLAKAESEEYQFLNHTCQYTEIKVADNGIGFEQEYSEKIFEIFQRLHDRSNYEGTGIGLALCNKIVINHKGVIFARSEEGKGATFYIILPLKQH